MNTNQTAITFFEQKLQFEAEMSLVKNVAEKKDQNYIILDVRSKDAFDQGHIPTAINIPRTELADRLHELPKDKTIITYCYHPYCFASAKAALELSKNGFKAMEMPGGFEGWQGRNNPVHVHGKQTEIVCDC